jgi:hypothetical protein
MVDDFETPAFQERFPWQALLPANLKLDFSKQGIRSWAIHKSSPRSKLNQKL